MSKPKSHAGRLGARVPIADFLHAVRMVTKRYEQEGGEHSMERTMGMLCDLFPRKSGKPASIILRMQALNELKDHPLMRAWKLDSGRDDWLVEEALFKAAARHPLDMRSGDFKPDSFFELVLKHAARAGKG